MELIDLYRRTAGTFSHFLLNKPEGEAAKRYIVSRGISDPMIEKFKLGFAPEDRNWLFGFLKQKGYSEDFLAASGLFSAKHKGLPLFSGRLIFPISDRQANVVAFGGRALAEGADTPKYINSPETAIYRKGEALFALDLAIPQIRQEKTVYIAEGYMDVIALHQAGICNSVAPLGTALTNEQAKLLRRWAERAVLVFDTDRAGQEAAVKAILVCRKNNLPCSVIVPDRNLPDFKDPAEILLNSGSESLQKMMKCFITDFDYLLRRAVSLYDMSSSEGKARGTAFIFPYLETLDSEVSRDACIESAAMAFHSSRDAIRSDLRRRSGESRGLPKGNTGAGSPGTPITMNDELYLLMVVAVNDMLGNNHGFPQGGTRDGVNFLYPELRRAIPVGDIGNPDAKELYIALEECFVNEEKGADSFLSRLDRKELKDFFLRRGSSDEFTGNSEKLMKDSLRTLKKKKLEKELAEIVFNIRSIGAISGISEDELIAEKMAKDEELRLLKESL